MEKRFMSFIFVSENAWNLDRHGTCDLVTSQILNMTKEWRNWHTLQFFRFVLLNCGFYAVYLTWIIFFEQGWFHQYRERIIEAEQLILTTLNFELNVQHPFESLTVTLKKLGFQQSVLVNLALHWASEG